ncbi:MAG TPA: hypothetical protein VER57_06105 [Cyanobium sp.]|nr:hypothetical protein [Cyanobium sp.]
MRPDPAAAFVIDTSALLRLYLADGPLPPSLEPAMERGCRGDAFLLVPDLCLLECASVLLKQVQRSLLTPEESRALLADLLQLPLRPTASAELITADEQLAKAARSLGCLA